MTCHLAIIGRGRLGRSLERLLGSSPWTLTLVGRPPYDESLLAAADAVLLAVPDRAVAEAARLVPEGPVVLHCSGALDTGVLRPRRRVGSFHPLMTFPGPEVALPDLTGVPAALAGDPDAVAFGRRLAHQLGMQPLHVPGDRRLYHAAAVMAGNFATVLLADAARVLHEAGVARDEAASALLPLALASLRNASPDPARALTGPAARGDLSTVQAHQEALEAADLPAEAEVYRTMSLRALQLARQGAEETSEH